MIINFKNPSQLFFNGSKKDKTTSSCNMHIHKPDLTVVEKKSISKLQQHPSFKDATFAIMPDFETYEGGFVGVSISPRPDLLSKVPVNILGNDIGCGVLLIKTDKKIGDVDFEKLDKFIKFQLFNNGSTDRFYQNKKELDFLNDTNFANQDKLDRIIDSFGTLGGGNHFVEIDADENGYLYIAVHSGSRKLGPALNDYFKSHNDKNGNYTNSSLDIIQASKIANRFARKNRFKIATEIQKQIGGKIIDMIDCPHNYISDNGTIHKGSIDASNEMPVIVPLNMKDGIIIGSGKGALNWNSSSPHGSGRKLSRKDARATIDYNDYVKSMSGIYSSSISRKTIDESPQAYNESKITEKLISDTVQIKKIIKPLYNYRKK